MTGPLFLGSYDPACQVVPGDPQPTCPHHYLPTIVPITAFDALTDSAASKGWVKGCDRDVGPG